MGHGSEAQRLAEQQQGGTSSLLVLTPLEHVQVDEVHRGQEARLLLGGRGGREDDRVVVVGVARAAQPAHIAAGPVALHRAELRLVAGRGDRHHEDLVRVRVRVRGRGKARGRFRVRGRGRGRVRVRVRASRRPS